MKTFRTSITARLVSLSIGGALVGAGLIPIVGLDPAHALPAVFLIAIAGCLVGLVLGVNDHPGPVALLALLLPLALWPFTMVAMLVTMRFGHYGWALVTAGAVTLFSTVIAQYTVTAEASAALHEDPQR